MVHLPIGRALNHARIHLKLPQPQQLIVIGRLLVRRNSQPMMVGIERRPGRKSAARWVEFGICVVCHLPLPYGSLTPRRLTSCSDQSFLANCRTDRAIVPAAGLFESSLISPVATSENPRQSVWQYGEVGSAFSPFLGNSA
jgi:hypothetical protein